MLAKMSKETLEALMELAYERIADGIAAAKNYSEYQEAQREKDAIFDKLEEQVGFKAISRFSDACCRVYSLEFTTLYFQGLRDGALLAKVGDIGSIERIIALLELRMFDEEEDTRRFRHGKKEGTR